MSTPSQTPAQAQIVKRGDTNFTLYYNTLNYFKTIMKNHPTIAHVTQGDVFSIDNVQFPQYPVGNVLIQDAVFGQSTTDYRIQLIIADKHKILENESDGAENKQSIPFYGTDDVVDIHANTLSVINDLTAYTQNKIQGFEINGDITCEPFVDRFDNGLAGWSATFNLTCHNDKNRCLFFLIAPEGQYFKIQDCETEQVYNAVLNTTGSIGQIFATNYIPNSKPKSVFMESYENIRCFEIQEEVTGRDDYDFWGLPVLAIPYEDFESCEACELWTSPKIWSTTPERWDGGHIDEALRKWQYT
jgi:hypothetical protein